MVNPNKKVKRPDGLGKVYRYIKDEESNIQTLPILDIIKENYIYIYRAIQKDNFYIKENDSCFFFKEILYDNEVVGFATYRATNISETSLIMQYIYILPDYRGNGLLEEELDESSALFESNIFIEYPNRYVIDSLINHRLARVYDDRIVISKIGFMVPMVAYDEIKKGTLREEYTTEDNRGFSKATLTYDLDIDAVVCLSQNDSDKIYNGKATEDELNDYNIISLTLTTDDKDFNTNEKRANDEWIKEGTYFKNFKEIVDKYDDEIQNWLSIV